MLSSAKQRAAKLAETIQQIKTSRTIAELEAVITVHNGLELRVEDYRTLMAGRWLNDSIIHSYLTLLSKDHNSLKERSVHNIDPILFEKISSLGAQSIFTQNQRNDNILNYRLIIVPIHKPNHWCIAIINTIERRVTYYDSLNSKQEGTFDVIRSLLYEYQRHYGPAKKQPWKFVDTYRDESIPRQNNFDDCGVFVCAYAKYLAAGHSLDFSQKDMAHFRKMMVVQLLANKFERFRTENVEINPIRTQLDEPGSSVSGIDDDQSKISLRSKQYLGCNEPSTKITMSKTKSPTRKIIHLPVPTSCSVDEKKTLSINTTDYESNEFEPAETTTIDLIKAIENHQTRDHLIVNKKFLQIVGHRTSIRKGGVTFDVILPKSRAIKENVSDKELQNIDEKAMFRYMYRLSVDNCRVWNNMKKRSELVEQLMLRGIKNGWPRE